jgi:hypothetical protein
MKLTSGNSRFIAVTAISALALSSFTFGANASTTKTAPKAAASAPAKIGTPCTSAGATTTVAGKTLSCVKALSGKLIWSAAAATPALPGGHADGPSSDPAFAAAMTKYTACLKAQGVTLPDFGRGRGFGRGDHPDMGAPTGAPTGAPKTAQSPAPRPTLSAKQQAAMAKCASLRPAFGGGRGFGGPGGTAGAPGAGAPGIGGPGVANTPANVTAYIACLNTNGVNVSTLADLQGLDRQSPKIAAALAACRSKRVAGN